MFYKPFFKCCVLYSHSMPRNSTLLLIVHPNTKYQDIKPNITYRECSTCLAHREEVITLCNYILYRWHMLYRLECCLFCCCGLGLNCLWNTKTINQFFSVSNKRRNISKWILDKIVGVGGDRVTFHCVSRRGNFMNVTKWKPPE